MKSFIFSDFFPTLILHFASNPPSDAVTITSVEPGATAVTLPF